MKKTAVATSLALLLGSGLVQAQSDTEAEVTQTILDTFAYSRENLKGRADDYSEKGALEFWSSGGLLQEVDGSPEGFEIFNLTPKHIRVVVLVEGQAAVAHYYSEGSLQPAGAPAVGHYLTRVSQAFVKEGGRWKVRSTHWSAVTGGSGTTQTAPPN